jgi:hypothetical protein
MTCMEVRRRTSQTIGPVTRDRSGGGRPTERWQDKSRCRSLAKHLSAHAFQACRRAVGVPSAPETTNITMECAAPRRTLTRMSRR